MDSPSPDWFKVGSVWRLKHQILLAPIDGLSSVENQTNLGLSTNSMKMHRGAVVVIIKPFFTETSVQDVVASVPDYYGFEIRLLGEDGNIGDRHLYVETTEESHINNNKTRREAVWKAAWDVWNFHAEPII
jgi:hypothetical protein